MEEKNEELNLKFESDNAAETLALARRELADELADSQIDEPADGQADGRVDEPADGQVESSSASSAALAAPEAPAAAGGAETVPPAENEAVLPRSRMPMNRPAGTPPLGDAPSGRVPGAVAEVPLEGRSYGSLLRELRERRGLSYDDLESATKIAPHYLAALEAENLDALPPVVYVIAYIRTLCRFYGIEDARSTVLLQELKKKLEYSCTDELFNAVEIDQSVTEEHERLLRRVLWGAAATAGVLILGTALWIFWAAPGGKAPKTPRQAGEAEMRFDASRLDSLLEPPVPELSRLPAAE